MDDQITTHVLRNLKNYTSSTQKSSKLRPRLQGSRSLLIRQKIDADPPPANTNTKWSDTLSLRYPRQSCSESELVSFGSLLCRITSTLLRVDATDLHLRTNLVHIHYEGVFQ